MIIILCIKIFFARIIDVSLGTIKTIYIVKEKRLMSTAIAFFEVFIWFIIAKEALSIDSNSILIPIIYSLGYATGTFIGILLSSKYITGNLTIHIISNKQVAKALNNIKQKITILNINKNYTLIEINKKDLIKIKESILSIDPHAHLIYNESIHYHT